MEITVTSIGSGSTHNITCWWIWTF